MSEELLDRPEVGAALEEVRGEGVAEAVGVGQQLAEGRGLERLPARGEEERVERAPRQVRAPIFQIAPQVVGRLFSQGNDPFLAALAVHVDDLLLEVDVRELQVDGLLRPDPAE